MVSTPASNPRPAAGTVPPMAGRLAWPTSRRRPGSGLRAGLAGIWSLHWALARHSDRAAAQWATNHARVAANRIFALEHSGLPLLQLAAIARRELACGTSPAQAALDSLALAAMAAQSALGLRPHLPQLAAALLVLQDRAVEMPPGEGKTLALALAAAVRALAGIPVHVVVRDGYRAREDMQVLRPFYQALGIAADALGSDGAEQSCGCPPQVCYAALPDLVLAAARPHGALSSSPPDSASALIDDVDAILVDDAGSNAQSWFGGYRRLGGVSATVAEARRELEVVYGLGVTRIPSIYPSFRHDRRPQVVAGRVAWQQAVVARVKELVRARRPVVVGIAYADGGGALLQALREAGLAVTELGDAPIGAARGIAAGGAGAVTVCEDAADCADIVPDPVARAAGGLAVLVTTVGETRRVDRRWRQLAGRRGQPGSTEAIVALPQALGGEHAWLPRGLMRSLTVARRDLMEWRASAGRRRRARARTVAPAAEPSAAWPQAAHLQHEGH